LKPASDLISTSVRDAYRWFEFASAWIDRLYGPETTEAVGLAERMERVNQRRAKARATDAGP